MRLAALLTAACLAHAADPYAADRERMVREQIENRGIKAPAVLRAMRETLRHEFMPAGVQSLAYRDTAAPIGYGQTISQPYIVGLMSELLAAEKTHRVLEIGTGSGYQAAILSKIAGQVYSIEIVPSLAEAARAKLAALGYKNVIVRTGDGYKGWPDQAPFDRIILTAAPPEIPLVLYDELKPGGRMVAPVGQSPADQELLVIDKDEKGGIRKRSVIPVRFVPMVPGRTVPPGTK